ncbi:MAG TPA: non-homologous end-joining DNA ligase, partial [Candidatus Xenobia bacterium]
LAEERGLEGVMAKHQDSRYEETRSPKWLKIKKTATVDAAIGGYTTPQQGSRQSLGAVVLGLYEDGKLVPVGQAGSGFNAQNIQQLLTLLQPLRTDECPFEPGPKPSDPVVWVQPRLVCEVKYNCWTSDRKLRGPVFLRLRDDKDPSECAFESDTVPAEPRPATVGYTQLLSDESNKQTLQIEGRTLTFTNLDKVMYPQDGVTKRDILNFYDRISSYLLPYLHDHPLNLKRYPNGIEGEFFFQRHATDKFPAWLSTVRIETSDGKLEDVFVANDRATLLYLVNLGCLDQNMWLSTAGSLDQPDVLLLDLDPVEGCTVDTLVAGANALHEVLVKLGLRGYPKTSGGRGMHIWVPLQPGYTFEQCRMLAQVMGHMAARRHPKVFSFNRVVEKREKGRVYLDTPQNRRGSSIAAPYVLRAFPGAAVATPLAWDEMKPGLDPKAFNIRTMFDRLEKVGDLFRPVLDDKQSLEAAIHTLEG